MGSECPCSQWKSGASERWSGGGPPRRGAHHPTCPHLAGVPAAYTGSAPSRACEQGCTVGGLRTGGVDFSRLPGGCTHDRVADAALRAARLTGSQWARLFHDAQASWRLPAPNSSAEKLAVSDHPPVHGMRNEMHSKEASVSEGGSPAPVLMSLPYGSLVETPLERDKPIGNEAQPGTTSFNIRISLPILWARHASRMTPLAPEYRFTPDVVLCGEATWPCPVIPAVPRENRGGALSP